MIRLALVARVIASTAGVNALRRALPLYLAVGLEAAIIFAGNGMNAATVVRIAASSLSFRLTLLTLWGMATVPAVDALLASPQTFFLRVLPVPTIRLLAVFSVAILLAEAPWSVLWAVGASPQTAVLATLSAMALHVSMVAGLRQVSDVLRLLCVIAAWSLPLNGAVIPLVGVVFLSGISCAWRRAPERLSPGLQLLPRFSSLLALAAAFGLSLFRGSAAVVMRALVLAAFAWLSGALYIVNNQIGEGSSVLRVAAFVWQPTCVLSAVGLAGPVFRTEAGADWVLSTCTTSRKFRVSAASLLIALLFGVSGLIFGLTLGAFANLIPSQALRVGMGLVVAGATLGIIAAECVRVTMKGGGRDSGRLMLLLVVVISGSIVGAVCCFELSLLLMVLVAGGISWWSGRESMKERYNASAGLVGGGNCPTLRSRK